MTYRLPVDLEQAGRIYVYDTGESYRVYSHAFGNYEIECGATGETVFFQGDSAFDFECELEIVEAACGNIDELCSGYFGNG